MSSNSNNEDLELTFALKHIDQHLIQNDFNTKKLLKLQQRIILKEKMISCKGAVKIYQAYESLLQDIQNNINTIDHAIRLCPVAEIENKNDAEDSFKDIIYDIEMDYNSEPEESTAVRVDDHHAILDNESKKDNDIDEKDDKKTLDSESSPLPLDTLVAALTLTAEGSNEWILARIRGFNGKLYTVEDAEIEEEPSIEIAQKEVYQVDPSHVTLIPENEETALARVEFRLKQNVLALFPGTTCFYSSIVMSQPSRRKKTRDYLLKFADDDVSSRPCAARYVLPFPNK